jgi:hypothetical protein
MIKLPDLFVGPLGKAQLDAIEFTEGMKNSMALAQVLEKLGKVENILITEGLSETERVLAEKIKSELEDSLVALALEHKVYGNGKIVEKPVL